MSGFTKLFSTIIHSTVWREEMHTKVVWVTMLAMADRNGRVFASMPGLADASRVSLGQCEEALARLSGPDKHSRTKDHEGRRIQEIDGGWQLLNYLKYREMRDMDERRIQTREAVKRHRERKAEVSQRKPCKPKKAQAEAEAEADNGKQTSVAIAPASWSREACEDWMGVFNGTAPGGQIGKALKPLVTSHGWAEVRTAWRSYLAQTEPEFASPSRFASTYGRWNGTSAVPVGKESLEDHNRRVIAAYRRPGEEP